MDKKDFYFFNVNEICTLNYHLRVNSNYRLTCTNERSAPIIDAELVKVIANGHLITLEFHHLNGDGETKIKFNVFSNVNRDWKIYDDFE